MSVHDEPALRLRGAGALLSLALVLLQVGCAAVSELSYSLALTGCPATMEAGDEAELAVTLSGGGPREITEWYASSSDGGAGAFVDVEAGAESNPIASRSSFVLLRATAPGSLGVVATSRFETYAKYAIYLLFWDVFEHVYRKVLVTVADECTIAILPAQITILPPEDRRRPTDLGQGPVQFADSDFDPGDWSVALEAPGGFTQAVQQRAAGGAPGAYRRMVHRLPGAGRIDVYHVYLGQSYSPRAQGAIDHLDYREDRIEFNPQFSGAQICGAALLLQDGQTYVARHTCWSNLRWEEWSLSGLGAADFTNAGGQQPDFSAAGGVIQLGYRRSNSTPSVPWVTEHGIDNWEVTVYPAPR